MSNHRQGVNYILIFRGSRWGTYQDGVIVLGSRYDSDIDSDGVDGNGSGMAVFLEVARILTMSGSDCARKNTIILVAFDAERYGGEGSQAFIDNYLVPSILQNFAIPPSTYQGTILLDYVMNYDANINSQTLPLSTSYVFPTQAARLRTKGYRGDFLIALGRQDDKELASAVRRRWSSVTSANILRHKYDFIDFPLPVAGSFVLPPEVVAQVGEIASLDRQKFWTYRGSYSTSGLKCLMISDTTLLRGILHECAEADCDDSRMITDDNLGMMATLTDVLVQVLLALATEDQDLACLPPVVSVTGLGVENNPMAADTADHVTSGEGDTENEPDYPEQDSRDDRKQFSYFLPTTPPTTTTTTRRTTTTTERDHWSPAQSISISSATSPSRHKSYMLIFIFIFIHLRIQQIH